MREKFAPGKLVWAGLFLILAFSVAWVGPCYGQSAASATILGSVTDPKGASVPSATVVVKNLATGIERTTTTTSSGLYVVPNLAPGAYDVRVEKAGFAPGLAKDIHIDVGDQRDVNFKLALATLATRLSVMASTPIIETTKTDVSMVVNDADMAGLPVTSGGVGPTNDYAGLAMSAPGVRADVTGNTAMEPIGPGAYNYRGNIFNIDGANITDQVVNGRDALGASLNEVKEFQVITNSYNAEYGQAGSLIINVITKSGTNSVHGQAWSYFRGRNLSASNFFYNLSPDSQFRRAPFQKQEWGANAGGPFVKDRAFWFVDYEKTHVASPLTLVPGGVPPITVGQPVNEVLFTVKTDVELSKQHHLSVRFNAQRQVSDNLLVQVPQTAEPESLTFFAFHDHMLNIGLTSTFTPHTVNEARFLWHRYLNVLPDKSTLPGQSGPDFYTGAAFCCPQGGLQSRYQYIDNLTWLHGTHTIKGGFNISHFPYFSLFQQFHFGEYLSFPSGTTLANRGTTGHFPTNFELGVGPGTVNSNDDIYGFYAQDSWKIRPNLTLNYGLRYDLEVGAFRGGTLRNPLSGGGCLQSNGLIPACSSDHNNFQPRLGLAWGPNFQSGFLHTVFGGPGRSVIRLAAAEVTEMAYLNVVLDSLNFDGNTLLTASISNPTCLQTYYPNFPNLSDPNCALPPRGSKFGRIRPISPELRNPEFRHFSLDISRQIANSYVLDLEYIGVLGFGQFGERDLNFPPVIPDPAHPGFFYFGSRPNPRFTAIRTNENSRTSAYHGFIVHVTKRVSHHFQFQGGYTFSKTISSTEDFYGTSEPGDPRNIRAERALAENDMRHVGNFSFVVDSQGAFRNSFWGRILGNWTMGWLGQLHSGNPYPVSTGDAGFAGSIFPGLGSGSETQQRPNVLPDGTIVTTNIASNSGTNLLVGPNGAAMCGCPQTTFLAPAGADPRGAIDSFTGDLVDFQFVNGNLARDAAKTRPFYRFDASIGKSFHFVPNHENWQVEFRADFFNIFNHPNFMANNSNDVLNVLPIAVNCTLCLDAMTGHYIGSDGRVLHIQDLRSGRVSSDILNPIFGGFGDPAATDIPREIQLSIHIKW